MQTQNQYFDYLIDQSFQVVNRPFVLSFETNAHQTSFTRYYIPNIKPKDYYVMINLKQKKKTFLILSTNWFKNIWQHQENSI